MQKTEFESMTAVKFEDGTCFWNRDAGPGGCVNKQPDILPRNLPIYKLFNLTAGCMNTVGMDGVPTGRDMQQVKAVAEALQVDWDEETVEKYNILCFAWLKRDHMKRESQRKAEASKRR
jgi:hypothetical protein